MTRGRAVCIAVAAHAAVAATVGVAHAQSTVIAPSIAVGAGYDSNVFWQPTSSTAFNTDQLWRVTPGIDVRHQSEHQTWGGNYEFDAERYQRHPELSTPFARQTATLFDHVTASPFTTWTLDGRFDSTLAPSDLNLTTGLIVGRVRASRWAFAPRLTHDITPRLQVYATYQFALDRIALSVLSPLSTDSHLVTNAAASGATFHLDARNDLLGEYRHERFDFAGGSAIDANIALVGWSTRLTPATEVAVRAGPRWAMNRIVPEVDASIMRRQGESEASVSYVRTETTALGIPGVVDVERALATGVYQRPGRFGASVEAGFFDNVQRGATGRSDLTTLVYHLGASLTVPLGGPVSIRSTYALDRQHGAIAIGVEPASSVLIDPNGTVTRHLVLVQFVVSRPLRPAPAARQSVDSIRRP